MTDTTDKATTPTEQKPFWQLRSFIVLVALIAIAVVVYLLSLGMDGSQLWLPDLLRNTGSPVLIRMSVIGLIPILIVSWFLFSSPFSKKVRFAPLGFLIVFIIGFFSLVVVESPTGDMTPRFTWRWNYIPEKGYEGDFTNKEKLESTTEINLTDFPQFLGPNRNGKVIGIELDQDWKSNPPKEVWALIPDKETKEGGIGSGWSGIVTKGLYAVTHEQRKDKEEQKEVVTCYHLLTGKPLWAHSNIALHSTGPGGVGPRATPTIDGDKVYAMGATGILDCIELESGKLVWTKDVLEDNDAEEEHWGKSNSPLVFEDKVIVGAGGKGGKSLVAYDKLNGDVVWKAGVKGKSEACSYASPIMATIAGVQQVLYISEQKISGHDPKDGKILWDAPWYGENSGNPNISQPIPVSGDRIFLSKGYGGGSKLIQISKKSNGKFTSKEVWANKAVMKTKFSNAVVVDGYVYGADGLVLQCIELATGKKRWRKGRYGHAQILMVGDVILVMDESRGELSMIRPNPKKLEVLGKIKILNRKTWNTLAISGPYLLARNDKEAVCYKLPVKKISEKKPSEIKQPVEKKGTD